MDTANWPPLKNSAEETSQVRLNKDVILKALKRDQDKLLNPQTQPFTSLKNAYDSLLPYHLFLSPTYDDLIYQTVKREPKPSNTRATLQALGEILFRQESSIDELAVMEERLRVEEERYYLNKTINYRKTKIKEIEERIINQ
ncbi:hypothetical protein NEHOM01_0253 [Nematocida homosporus]|uniref:uncharacterized protein n=1 Tax=Nematocida homosporus TaxID=1912981 RepID=UPI00221F3D71|nr:uncharacterized protein NEHOM01_0253 [Nematocida homosporus]KAI5184578.1 hypothetical protein NEHOM01_0253 [Nematocida homosporus]